MEDRQRFARFVEEHMAVVYAAAYSAIGDRALSEEVAQETFLCAWRKLPALDRPPAMPGWLCGIARMVARNVRRRRGREQPLLDEVSVSSAPSPLDALLAREREALVRRALARVPRRYREPLVLYYQGEESVHAVAAALGLSEDAVRQRLSRGRKHLRDEVHLVERELHRSRPRTGLAAAIAAAFIPTAVARASSLASLLSFAPAAAIVGVLGSFSIPPAVASDPIATLLPITDPDPDPEPEPDSVPDSVPDSAAVLSFSPVLIARRLSPVARRLSPVSPVSDDDDFSAARELVRRGFPTGAIPHLERVLQRDLHHKGAVDELIKIARAIPDPAPAIALLANSSIDPLPADIAYLLARHHYAGDPARALRLLDTVPATSPRHLDARQLAGVIHVRLGQPAAAVRAFESVVAAASTSRLSRRARDAARDRALLDLGRLHYGARRYTRALEAFSRIPRRSPAWPTALFESTWAYLRAGDAARGLGHIHSLRSPYLAAFPFPEASKVEAIFYFQRCHFRRAQRVTRDFEVLYRPVLASLERITAASPGDDAGFLTSALALRAAAPSPFAGSPARAATAPVRDLTRLVAAGALDDRDVDRAIAGVREIDQELARLARTPVAWRAGPLASALVSDLSVERDLAVHAAGRLARTRLTRTADELRALQGDMRRIRIEILEIRAAHVGGTLPAEPDPTIYAIDDQASFWPFDGEYWRDEVGRYYVDLVPACGRTN